MKIRERRARGLAIAGALSLAACAARLENPEAFADRAPLGGNAAGATMAGGATGDGGTGGAATFAGASATLGGTTPGGTGGAAAVAGTSGSAGASTGDLPACVAAVFVASTAGKCSNGICHHAGDGSGGLDLASPGVTARLLDQPASHAGASPSSGCPQGDKLIDSQDPSASWLLKKLTLDSGAACGAKMPLTGSLSADELSCLTQWVGSF